MALIDDQVDIQEELKAKLTALPFGDKVRSVALNSLLSQKKVLDTAMEKEIRAIEAKYLALSEPIFSKNNDIIEGVRNPDAEELADLDNYLNEDEKANKNKLLSELGPAALQNYWARVFKNCEVLSEEVREADEPIMNHLVAVRFVKGEEDGQETQTFEFKFSSNEYFTNETLSKKFYMKEDDSSVLSKGTEIQWNEGKNVTVKIVKKKQKNKKSGQSRTINKEVEQESFFNFFKDVDARDEKLDEMDEEEAEKLQERNDIDLEIGQLIQEEAIPYSLEYYLEIRMPGYQDGELDEGQDDDSDKDDDNDDEDEAPKQKKNTKPAKAPKNQAGEEPKPECKQQ